MNIQEGLLYTEQHEWLKIDGQDATVGISDYAQHALGDITFIDLPKVGRKLAKGEEAAAIESCKAAASVYSPAAGEVSAVNDALNADPAIINGDPYIGGWIYKMKLLGSPDVANLMDATAYRAFCDRLS